MIKHILLIDDNEIDNYITRQLLTRFNIAETISTQCSATEALAFLGELIYTGQSFPEIIFLDIRMPEMDGFGFLENFEKFNREHKESCSIFMLSSSQNLDDITRAKENPYVKEYLQKPITREAVSRIFKIQVAA
jgi:CheY-like chemotaxis protein